MTSVAKDKPGRRPRGRKPRADVREQILKSASELFAERGISAVTMADLAREVGLRAPSLYYWFADKDEIVAALASYSIDVSLAYATEVDAEDSGAATRLYLLLRQHFQRLSSAPYDLSCLVEAPELRRPQFDEYSDRVRAWGATIQRLIVAGAREGELIETDPVLAFLTIIGLIEGVLSRRRRVPERTPEQTGEYVAKFALRALVVSDAALDKVMQEATDLGGRRAAL
jgi:AcrR family transcriptional regulator